MLLSIKDVPTDQKFLLSFISPEINLMTKTCINFNLVTVKMVTHIYAALTSLEHLSPSLLFLLFILAWTLQPHRISLEEFLTSPTLFKTQSLILLIESMSQCHHITCIDFSGATLGPISKIVSNLTCPLCMQCNKILKTGYTKLVDIRWHGHGWFWPQKCTIQTITLFSCSGQKIHDCASVYWWPSLFLFKSINFYCLLVHMRKFFLCTS